MTATLTELKKKHFESYQKLTAMPLATISNAALPAGASCHGNITSNMVEIFNMQLMGCRRQTSLLGSLVQTVALVLSVHEKFYSQLPPPSTLFLQVLMPPLPTVLHDMPRVPLTF